MTQSASTAGSSIESELKGARSSATKLRVFHIPDDILTFVTIAPEQIESFSAVEVHEVTEKGEIDGTLAALVAAQPHPASESAEMRWKLVFSDAADARILEVYAASRPRQLGLIGKTYVAFANEALTAWLYKNFA